MVDFKMVDPTQMWTPKGISAAAAVLITEKMPQYNDEGQLIFDNEHFIISDVLNNRTLLADETALGSSKSPTIANTAMKYKQFSGLNNFSKNFYEEDVSKNPMSNDQYDQALLTNLITDMTNKANARNQSVNPQDIANRYNSAKEWLTNNYLPSLYSSGESGISMYPQATNFFHPQSTNLSEATDIQGLANQQGHYIYNEPQYKNNLEVKGSYSASPTNINRLFQYLDNPGKGIMYGNAYSQAPMPGFPGEDVKNFTINVPQIENKEVPRINKPEKEINLLQDNINNAVETVVDEVVPKTGEDMISMIIDSRNTPVPGMAAKNIFPPKPFSQTKAENESKPTAVEQLVASLGAGDMREINRKYLFKGAVAAKDDEDIMLPELSVKGKPMNFGIDTIPAMLTEGEAVIPTEAAQIARNRAEIERMVKEGREIQDRKNELNIPLADNSKDEVIADEILGADEMPNVNTSIKSNLQPYMNVLNARVNPQQYISDASNIDTKIFSPPNPNRAMAFNEAANNKEINIQKNNMPMQFANTATLLDVKMPSSNIPMNFSAAAKLIKPEAVTTSMPYTPEKFKEIEDGIKTAEKINIQQNESIPLGTEADFKNIVKEQLNNFDLINDTVVNKETGEKDSEATGIWAWIKNTFDFTKQDAMRGMLYYFGSRIAGYDHRPSLTFAGKQVLSEYKDRKTLDFAKEKLSITEKGKDARARRSDIFNSIIKEAQQKLKDNYFTPQGARLVNAAMRSQDFTELNRLLASTEDTSIYNPFAVYADLDKRKKYYFNDGHPSNNIMMAPSKSDPSLLIYKTNDGQFATIPATEMRELKEDIDFDNAFGKVIKSYENYRKVAKDNPKDETNNYNKLKRHYQVKDANDFKRAIDTFAREYDVGEERTMNLINSLLAITPDNAEEKDLSTDLGSALTTLMVLPQERPDIDKLRNFNQSDINKMVEDFGSTQEVTKHAQTVDTYLAGDQQTGRPPVLIKDLNEDSVNADIDSKITDEAIKTKIKSIPNLYWRMVYLEYYTSRS